MADNIQDGTPVGVPRTASLGLHDIQVLPTTQPSIPNLQEKPTLDTQVIPKGQALPPDLSVAGELLQKAPDIVEPSAWSAFHQNLAPMAKSIGQAIYEDVVYPHQVGYDPTIRAKAFIDANGITKQEDVVYLNGAVSTDDAAYREQRVHDDRAAANSFAAHPWIGTGASLADADLLTLAIPIGGEATVGSKLAIRAGIAATYAGAAAGANALLPNQLRTQDERNMDSLTMGLAGAFTPLHFGTKVVTDTALAPGIATESKLVANEVKVVTNKQYSGLSAPLGISGIPLDIQVQIALRDSKAEAFNAELMQSTAPLEERQAKAMAFHDTNTLPVAPRTPAQAADIFSGTLPVVHGSKVGEITFQDTVPTADKSYSDNVFGDNVIYTAENRQWTPDEAGAADMRMPYYPNVHAGTATFNKAFVLTPDSITRLPKAAHGDGTTIVAGLRSLGYDGLIIRGFKDSQFKLNQGLAELGGIDEAVLQDQVVSLKHSQVNLTPSTRATLDADLAKLQVAYPSTTSSTLGADIAIEASLVAADITAHADSVGVLTKANILGEEVRLPISQPLPEGHMIPDMSKDHAVIADIQSSADTMWHLTKGDRTNVLNNVLAAPRTQGDNAATLTAATQAVLESKLVGTEQAIDAAARELGGTSPFMWFGRKRHTEWLYNVSRQFGDAMQKLDQQVVQRLNDGIITDTTVTHAMIDATDLPNAIKKIQHTYVDSGFAEEALRRAKHGGLLDHLDDVAALHPRPSYVPVKHSWEQMHSLVQAGRVTENQLHKFLGNQIIRMYPEMQGAKLLHGVAGGTTPVPRAVTLSAEDLGKNFYETLKERSLGLSNVTTAGITREQMVTLLRKAGVVDKDIENIANKVYHGTQQEGSGAAKNLRSRLAWDWTQSAIGKDGNTFSLGDLVDGNAFLNLSDYARTMSHRVGLAKYGIKTEADFNTLGEQLLQNLPAGVPLEKAREFLKNVKARSFGHTVGENLPAWVRSGQTLAGSMFLAGSGLYNIGDLATQVAKMGLLRTLPELRAGMKNLINPMKSMAANEAKDLQDILTGILSADGRWRNIQLRYADNFEIGNNVHNAIQYMGQSTKFMNGAEYVKRFQTGIIGGIFATAFKNAAKGSAKDIKYMKETLRISDDLTNAIIGEYKTHGAAVDLWNNSVRYSMEQKVFAEADNLALTIRNGEIPAFMEHSSVGKVLFPFMSFTMSTQNKVLRNTYARDGGAGVAMIAAVQLPTAILIAMSKNVIQGKEPDDKLAHGATNALSITGAFGYPLGIALDGGLKTSSTPIAPVSSALSLGQKMYKGNAGAMDYLKASPFGAAIGLQGFITAMESAH